MQKQYTKLQNDVHFKFRSHSTRKTTRTNLGQLVHLNAPRIYSFSAIKSYQHKQIPNSLECKNNATKTNPEQL